jgi:hypothetical protein
VEAVKERAKGVGGARRLNAADGSQYYIVARGFEICYECETPIMI